MSADAPIILSDDDEEPTLLTNDGSRRSGLFIAPSGLAGLTEPGLWTSTAIAPGAFIALYTGRVMDEFDHYNLPTAEQSTPDLWTTVETLAAQKISTTIVACSSFNASPVAGNVYSQLATRTNGRMVDFGLVQHALPQFLSQAAQEELFVQTVNQRISSLSLNDEEQEQAIQEAMRGIGDKFRSLSSEWDIVVPFEDTLFDRHTSSKEFRDGFRALGATKTMPSHATSECEGGDAMYTSLGAAEEEDGAPTFRSCSAAEDDASPPRSKRMATTPPPMPGYARTPSTTADRIRRA